MVATGNSPERVEEIFSGCHGSFKWLFEALWQRSSCYRCGPIRLQCLTSAFLWCHSAAVLAKSLLVDWIALWISCGISIRSFGEYLTSSGWNFIGPCDLHHLGHRKQVLYSFGWNHWWGAKPNVGSRKRCDEGTPFVGSERRSGTMRIVTSCWSLGICPWQMNFNM